MTTVSSGAWAWLFVWPARSFRVGRCAGYGGGGQVVAAGGGPHARGNRSARAVSPWPARRQVQGALRAKDTTRAGTVISLRRTVAVVDLARPAGACQGRCCAGEAERDHGQHQPGRVAVNLPEDRYASAELFSSEWICLMIACPQWVMSAATCQPRLGRWW